jgi:hypothetical protein
VCIETIYRLGPICFATDPVEIIGSTACPCRKQDVARRELDDNLPIDRRPATSGADQLPEDVARGHNVIAG